MMMMCLLYTLLCCIFTISQLQKQGGLLSQCYSALECVLQHLCANDDDQPLPVDAETFCQIHDAVLQATNGIFYLLAHVDSKQELVSGSLLSVTV
jgi:hypothetical protein